MKYYSDEEMARRRELGDLLADLLTLAADIGMNSRKMGKEIDADYTAIYRWTRRINIPYEVEKIVPEVMLVINDRMLDLNEAWEKAKDRYEETM